MPSQATAKTRILIISDTHSGHGKSADPYSSSEASGAFRPPLPAADVLLHTGDVSMVGTIPEYRSALAMLSSIQAPLKLVIAGNHDLSLDAPYFLHSRNSKGELHARFWMGWTNQADAYHPDLPRQARELWTGAEARQAGVTYLEEGLHEFVLGNGALLKVYASPWQPEFYNWAFNYPPAEDRWNPPHLVDTADGKTVPAPAERDPHPIPEGAEVDVVMTHGPPNMHLDKVMSGPRAGCPHLVKAIERVRPKIHCFGHIHEAWGAERVQWRAKGSNAAEQGKGTYGETTEIIGGRDDGGMGVTAESGSSIIRPNDKEVVERRAAFLDLSNSSKAPLKAGEETLFVNSCVVDLEYDVVNAGWLIDLELPVKKQTSRLS